MVLKDLIDENLKENKEERFTVRSNKRRKKKLLQVELATMATIFTVAGATVATMAKNAYERNIGRNAIISEFNQDYSIFEGTNGFSISDGVKQLKFEDAIEGMISSAYNRGLSKEKIYIGLKGTINKNTAVEALGFKLDKSEENKICMDEFYKVKYEELKEEKGAKK